VPTLLVERFGPPAGARDRRTRAYCDERVAAELAGRIVWCTPSLRAALERLLGNRAAVRSYAPQQLGRDDIVVLEDAPLEPEIRDRGAHAVVHVSSLAGASAEVVDAYLVAWSGHGALNYRIAAVMPRGRRVAEKDMRRRGDDLAWASMLADVVHDDRDELVGGRRQARPAVAAR
jgi:hypothetical protein